MHVAITEDADRARDEFLAPFGEHVANDRALRDELLASPVVAIGSIDEVCDRLLATRDDFGFSYFAPPLGGDPEAFAAAGRTPRRRLSERPRSSRARALRLTPRASEAARAGQGFGALMKLILRDAKCQPLSRRTNSSS